MGQAPAHTGIPEEVKFSKRMLAHIGCGERHGAVEAGALIAITDVNDPTGWQGYENCYLGISSFCAPSLSLGQEGVGHADLLCGRCSGRPVEP